MKNLIEICKCKLITNEVELFNDVLEVELFNDVLRFDVLEVELFNDVNE